MLGKEKPAINHLECVTENKVSNNVLKEKTVSSKYEEYTQEDEEKMFNAFEN
jgi:hypothetical protein